MVVGEKLAKEIKLLKRKLNRCDNNIFTLNIFLKQDRFKMNLKSTISDFYTSFDLISAFPILCCFQVCLVKSFKDSV